MEVNHKSILMSVFRILDHASVTADIIRKHNNSISLSDSDEQTLRVLAQLVITYKLKYRNGEK